MKELNKIYIGSFTYTTRGLGIGVSGGDSIPESRRVFSITSFAGFLNEPLRRDVFVRSLALSVSDILHSS